MGHILPMNDIKNKQTYVKDIYKALWNYALNYLARYEVSESKLKYKLYERKEKLPYAVENSDFETALEAVIEKLKSQNLLSDKRYGLSRLRLLSQRGKALYFIRQDLKQNGLDDNMIEDIIEEYGLENDVDLNRAAAICYMKKRRLGAFRSKEVLEGEHHKIRQKEAAALARQGFSYDLITSLLSQSLEELEDYTL